MSAANVARGLTTVNAGLTPMNANVFNNQCLTDMYVRGPMDGADPIDKVYVADVRRSYSGFLSDRSWVNAVKAQGAYEALTRVGIAQPNIVTVKNPVAAGTALGAVGTGGNLAGFAYGNLAVDMRAPYTGIQANLSNFNTNVDAGSVEAAFPNGTALISTGGRRYTAGAFAGTSKGASLAELAAASENATGQFAGGDDSFAQELNSSGDTIAGVQLFSAPRGPGDVANLGVSGANFVGALQAGNFPQAMSATGMDQYTNNLFPGLAGNPDLSSPAARQAAYSQFATVGGPSNPVKAGAASGFPSAAFLGGRAPASGSSCPSCRTWK